MHALHESVSALLREVAATIVLPRYRSLAAHEIIEKEPGDLVTIADRESELRLAEGLAAILPGSAIVGEEATAADPAVLDRIGKGLVWIIDPIDGTANFAAGRSPFALMVALANDGATEAGWIYDPVTGRMCHAALGQGAYIDGERVTARSSGSPLPLAALATRFLPEGMRAATEARAAGRLEIVDIPGCAGEQYPRLALGVNDLALFWRAQPWDHAPGGLFLTEAGGRIARGDGTDYRPDDLRTGLLAAASPKLWDEAAAALFD